MTKNSNVVPFRKIIANISVHEDANHCWLQIDFRPGPEAVGELKTDGMGITIGCSKNGDDPTCTLWEGRGERGLEHYDVETFRQFVEVAMGKKVFGS